MKWSVWDFGSFLFAVCICDMRRTLVICTCLSVLYSVDILLGIGNFIIALLSEEIVESAAESRVKLTEFPLTAQPTLEKHTNEK